MLTRTSPLKRTTPLSLALPGAQFGEWHSRVIPADPDRVWAALDSVRVRELTITGPLLRLRTGGRTGGIGEQRIRDLPSPEAPLLVEPPRVAAGGLVGMPWRLRPTVGPRLGSLEDLRAFTEPGWLKYGMEWLLTPLPGGGTLLETSTLCEATDAGARRRFRPYWLLIRAFSGLIRRDMLHAIERAALRG